VSSAPQRATGAARIVVLVAGNLSQPAMEAVTELVGLVITLGPTRASDHDAGGGHPGEASEPDELPAHAHQLRRVLG
jgi:hypothetical protein